jgi:hypothetical protein
MQLVRNLNPPLRLLYVMIGVLLIAYALYMHLLIAGLKLGVFIVLGVLLIAAGARGT